MKATESKLGNNIFLISGALILVLVSSLILLQSTLAQEGGGDGGGCCEGPIREPREPITQTTTTTTTTTPFCGDGTVNNGETCELPNTNNNPYCSQTTSDCSGNKTGTRDGNGNCNSNCGCLQDPFTYNCLKDSCGAQCDDSSDCQPKCVGDIRYFSGTCGTNSCSCSYQTENCNTGDGWYDTSGFSCDGACRRCKNQEFRNFGCTPGSCTYTVNDTRQVCENSPQGKHCDSGNFTTTGYCGSSSPYCGNGCSVKTDRFECAANNTCTKLDFTDTSFCAADTACSNGVCSSGNSCGSGDDVCTDGCTRARELLRCNGYGSCTNFWQFTGASSCNPYTCNQGSCTSTCNRDCGASCNSGEQETRNVSCTTSQSCPGTKIQKRVCLTGNCQFGDWTDFTTCQDTPGDYCPPVCGDGVINGNEICEPPNSYNNIYCGQSTLDCLGNKTGTRDLFGNCNSQCGCNNDPFNYNCVAGSCGAGCNVGEQETRNISCNTNQNCPGTLIQRRDCNGNSCQFGNWINQTTCQDTPGDFCPQVCGDGQVQNGELCELPNTYNNPYCSQTTSTCLGNKTGTRDLFGNCNSGCGCNQDPFAYNCLKDSCGAQCDDNSDCEQKCQDDRYLLTDGRCSSTKCSCSYTKVDCSDESGWYDTGETRTGPCPDDACKTCGEKEQEFREFFCGDDQCKFQVTDERWVQVNRTVIKCPTGYFCSQGICEKKECKGDVDIDVNLQICPKEWVTAYVKGLSSLCQRQRVYIREDSCDGRTLGTCVLNRNGECRRRFRFTEIGTPTLVACLDKNKDGDFVDSGEQDSITLNVNCNNCEPIGKCPLSVCDRCYRCDGHCNANTNNYAADKCLNPGESCTYSCVPGSCGALNCYSQLEAVPEGQNCPRAPS
ncbi:MAG: hypothetical protein J4452_00055 [Candidatus Aenigmarchaeota archaeon]|nr:hypothetical protein [Candidatus Aenigmarchaeota archaeon]